MSEETWERERRLKEEGEAFGKSLCDFAGMNSRHRPNERVKGMLEVIQNEHRTNKQGLMRLLMMIIGQFALDGSDGRNQASVDLAKEIMAIDERKRILPYI